MTKTRKEQRLNSHCLPRSSWNHENDSWSKRRRNWVTLFRETRATSPIKTLVGRYNWSKFGPGNSGDSTKKTSRKLSRPRFPGGN